MATEQELIAQEDEPEQVTSPFKKMTPGELASVCLEEIARGIGGNVSSDSDVDISLSLDYFLGRLPGITKLRAKDKQASRFVSLDVMDAVALAELMPAFTTDQVGVYEPEDERDEEMAQQETDIVNYLLMEEYDGYTLIQTALCTVIVRSKPTGTSVLRLNMKPLKTSPRWAWLIYSHQRTITKPSK